MAVKRDFAKRRSPVSQLICAPSLWRQLARTLYPETFGPAALLRLRTQVDLEEPRAESQNLPYCERLSLSQWCLILVQV